jgi:hypothetical protein
MEVEEECERNLVEMRLLPDAPSKSSLQPAPLKEDNCSSSLNLTGEGKKNILCCPAGMTAAAESLSHARRGAGFKLESVV